MEAVKATTLANQSTSTDQNLSTQDAHPISEHTASTQTIRRRHSIFSFASDIFRPRRMDEEEIVYSKQSLKDRAKVTWNPFVSLRGMRNNNTKRSQLATDRCKSSSPEKGDLSGIDELGMRKLVRRKSLQDLLGTVGRTLSKRHRQMPRNSVIQETGCFVPPEDLQSIHKIPPLALPEPAVRIPSPHSKTFGSLNGFKGRDLTGPLKDGSVPLGVKSGSSYLDCSPTTQMANFQSSCQNSKRSDINNIAADLNLNLNSLDNTTPWFKIHERSGSSEKERKSQDSGYASIVLDLQQNAKPKAPSHVRFSDEEGLPLYEYTKGSDDEIVSPRKTSLDLSFHGRLLERNERYNSICHGSPDDTQKELSFVLKKNISCIRQRPKDLQSLPGELAWSVDSSETESDDMSHMSHNRWDKNEAEFWNLVERGWKIMNEAKLCLTRPLSPFHPFHLFPRRHSGDWADDVLDKSVRMRSWEDVFDIGEARLVRKAVPRRYEVPLKLNGPRTSAEIGERFRSQEVIRQSSSTDHFRVSYPQNEFHDAYTKQYKTKNEAIGDLYQNHKSYSDYCGFDPVTRTIYPQTRGNVYEAMMDLRDFHDRLEVLWLPMEYSSIPYSIPPAAVAELNSGTFTNYVSDLSPASSSRNPVISGSTIYFTNEADIAQLRSPNFRETRQRSRNSDFAGSGKNEDERIMSLVEPLLPRVECKPHQHDSRRILAGTQEQPVSKSDGQASVELASSQNDVDESCGITLDSAIAGLYLGDFSLSSESFWSDQDTRVNSPDLANGMLFELNNAQLNGARHLKTWAQLGKDFLDKYAPSHEACCSERAHVAVQEVLKKRYRLLNSVGSSDTIDIENLESPFRVTSDHQKQQWSRDWHSSDEVSFKHIEDVAGYELAKEELARATTHLQLQDRISPASGSDNSAVDSFKGKGKNRVELNRTFVSSWMESDLTRDHLFQESTRPNPPDYAFSSAGSHLAKLSLDKVVVDYRSYGLLTLESEKKVMSESVCSDETAITLPTGYKFTQDAEQFENIMAERQCVASVDCEDKEFGSSKNIAAVSVYAVSNISIATSSLPRDDYLVRSVSKAELQYKFENSVPGKAEKRDHGKDILIDTNTSEGSRIFPSGEDFSLDPRSCGAPILLKDDGTYMDVLIGRSHAAVRSPKWLDVLNSNTIGPHHARRRVLQSNEGPVTTVPLYNFFLAESPTSPPSAAETKASETFGETLQRFGSASQQEEMN